MDMASYNIGSRQTEGPVMILHGIKWKCEGPCQVIDFEMASVSTFGYCISDLWNAFQSKTCDSANDY